jgi:hypothetical protein
VRRPGRQLIQTGQEEVVGTFVVGYIAPNGDWQVVIAPNARGQVTIQADHQYPEINGDPLAPVRTIDTLFSFIADFATRDAWRIVKSDSPVSTVRVNVNSAIQHIKRILP